MSYHISCSYRFNVTTKQGNRNDVNVQCIISISIFADGREMFSCQVDDARLDGGLRAGGVHQVLQPHQAVLRRPRRGGQPKQVI